MKLYAQKHQAHEATLVAKLVADAEAEKYLKKPKNNFI
jgi:hypothetical protein